MGFNSIKYFSPKHWLRLVAYSLGSRLIHSTPKGLRSTYDFVTAFLKENPYNLKKDKNFLVVNYPVGNTVYTCYFSQNSTDALVFHQIMVQKEYGSLIHLIKESGMEPQTMIDSGANIGLTTLFFKAYFPQLCIVALEPATGTYERLKLNIHKNKLENVILLKKGLWNKTTALKGDTTFRDGGDWSFRLVEASPGEPALFETTTVPEILKQYQWDTLDILKMDIEGSEKVVFDSQADLSWLSKVKLIAIEIHDEFNCREEIENMLLKAGFRLSHSGELTLGVNTCLLCNE